MKAGAEVDTTVTDGYYKGTTPLHLAAQEEHANIILLLAKAAQTQAQIQKTQSQSQQAQIQSL